MCYCNKHSFFPLQTKEHNYRVSAYCVGSYDKHFTQDVSISSSCVGLCERNQNDTSYIPPVYHSANCNIGPQTFNKLQGTYNYPSTASISCFSIVEVCNEEKTILTCTNIAPWRKSCLQFIFWMRMSCVIKWQSGCVFFVFFLWTSADDSTVHCKKKGGQQMSLATHNHLAHSAVPINTCQAGWCTAVPSGTPAALLVFPTDPLLSLRSVSIPTNDAKSAGDSWRLNN